MLSQRFSKTHWLEKMVQMLFSMPPALYVILLVAMASGIRWALDPWLQENAPFTVYILPVAIVAMFARFRFAILTLVIGALSGQLLWVNPRLSLQVTEVGQVVHFLLFVGIALSIATIVWAARVVRIFSEWVE